MVRASLFWHPSGVRDVCGIRTGGIGWVTASTPATFLHPSGVSGGQVVRLKFTKYGHDGVLIESRRNADAWNFWRSTPKRRTSTKPRCWR